MNEITPEDRKEWITEASDAIRGRCLVYHCDTAQAYEELRTQRVWRRDPIAASMLQEAFLAMK